MTDDWRTRAENVVRAARALRTQGAAREAVLADAVSRTQRSRAQLEWELDTSLAALSRPALLRFRREWLRPPRATAYVAHPRVGLWLAGNVWTAALRPMAIATLVGAALSVRESSRAPRLAAVWGDLLGDDGLRARFDVAHFPSDDAASRADWLAPLDAIHVYGSDAVIASMRAEAPITATYVPHGHGVSAAFISRAATNTPELATRAAARLALDLAAYDGDGCLSPRTIFVEGASLGDVLAWARATLAPCVAARSAQWPSSPLEATSQAAKTRWLTTMSALGDVVDAHDHAFGVVAADAPVPPSAPRTSIVRHVADRSTLMAALAGAGGALKCVGVAGPPRSIRTLARALSPRVAPRICLLGTMQSPDVTTPADGESPAFGFGRFVRSR